MKLLTILLLGFICFVFVMCSPIERYNSTPQIFLAQKPILTNGDTLKVTYVANSSYDYITDTVSVGDTIGFKLYLNADYNNLVEFDIERSDTISSKLLLVDESVLNTVFVSSASNYLAGKFLFRQMQNFSYFTFSYVAKAASTSAVMKLALQSDAYFATSSSSGTNYISLRLKIPIVIK